MYARFGPWEAIMVLLVLVALIFIIVNIVNKNQGVSKRLLASDSRQSPLPTYSPPLCAHAESESDYKNCPMCGEEIKSVAVKCKHCNSILQGKGDNSAMSNTGDGTLGTVSLVTGIVGFFIGILLVHLGVLLGLTAVVCGVLGQSKGQKHSLPGIVIGIAAVLFSLIYSFVSMSRF